MAYAAHAEEPPAVQDMPPSVSGALYRAALGPVNAERYLAAFERLDATGRALPGWNLGAAVCTIAWMVLRRLWRPLLGYGAAWLGLVAWIAVLWLLREALPVPVLAGLGLAGVLLVFAVPGLYGDVLVHRQVQRQIAAAVAGAPSVREAIALLEQGAVTRGRLAWVAAAATMAATLALTAGAAYLHRLGEAALVRQMASAAIAPEPVSRGEPRPEPPAAAAPGADAAPAAPSLAAPAATAPSAPEPLHPPAPEPPSVPAPETPPPAPLAPASAGAEARTARVPPKAAVSRPRGTAAAPPGEAEASAAARRLYVNVGLFAQPANARRAHARLRSAGLPSSISEVKAADGQRLQRVRVGPFMSASEANAAAARVQALGLDAVAAAVE